MFIIHPLINPDDDSEVRTNKIDVQSESSTLDNGRYFDGPIGQLRDMHSWNHHTLIFFNLNGKTKDEIHWITWITATFIIRSVQQRVYHQEISCHWQEMSPPPFSDYLFVDEDGLIPVGGSLKHFNGYELCKNPVIIPAKHHVATLIQKYHCEVKHQGRHLTAGRVSSDGFELSVVREFNHP